MTEAQPDPTKAVTMFLIRSFDMYKRRHTPSHQFKKLRVRRFRLLEEAPKLVSHVTCKLNSTPIYPNDDVLRVSFHSKCNRFDSDVLRFEGRKVEQTSMEEGKQGAGRYIYTTILKDYTRGTTEAEQEVYRKSVETSNKWNTSPMNPFPKCGEYVERDLVDQNKDRNERIFKERIPSGKCVIEVKANSFLVNDELYIIQHLYHEHIAVKGYPHFSILNAAVFKIWQLLGVASKESFNEFWLDQQVKNILRRLYETYYAVLVQLAGSQTDRKSFVDFDPKNCLHHKLNDEQLVNSFPFLAFSLLQFSILLRLSLVLMPILIQRARQTAQQQIAALKKKNKIKKRMPHLKVIDDIETQMNVIGAKVTKLEDLFARPKSSASSDPIEPPYKLREILDDYFSENMFSLLIKIAYIFKRYGKWRSRSGPKEGDPHLWNHLKTNMGFASECVLRDKSWIQKTTTGHPIYNNQFTSKKTNIQQKYLKGICDMMMNAELGGILDLRKGKLTSFRDLQASNTSRVVELSKSISIQEIEAAICQPAAEFAYNKQAFVLNDSASFEGGECKVYLFQAVQRVSFQSLTISLLLLKLHKTKTWENTISVINSLQNDNFKAQRILSSTRFVSILANKLTVAPYYMYMLQVYSIPTDSSQACKTEYSFRIIDIIDAALETVGEKDILKNHLQGSAYTQFSLCEVKNKIMIYLRSSKKWANSKEGHIIYIDMDRTWNGKSQQNDAKCIKFGNKPGEYREVSSNLFANKNSLYSLFLAAKPQFEYQLETVRKDRIVTLVSFESSKKFKLREPIKNMLKFVTPKGHNYFFVTPQRWNPYIMIYSLDDSTSGYASLVCTKILLDL